ncbi:hypothetical protein N0B21_20830 [Bacillus velezensis]|nr:hypothetical protein [Bacillus velezensis]MCT6684630.1 hypothetical protein [Bacillus velezensis]
MKKAVVIDVLSAPEFNAEEGLWEVAVAYKDSISNKKRQACLLKRKKMH